MRTPRIHSTYEGVSVKTSDSPTLSTCWNRPALARIFQAIDGCSQHEAESQIDAFVTEFQGFEEPGGVKETGADRLPR
jgi:hypothetical protein